MRVIVTGASGFLGKELVKHMREQGIDFLAATSRPSVLVEDIEIPDRLVVEARQLLCEETYKENDVIMNCAFPRTSDGVAMADGFDYLAQLIQCAMKSNIAGFVNISSQSVYDQHRTKPATEKDALCLESSYAVAKRGVELLLDAQTGSTPPYTNIRLASLIGPHFDQRVPNRMVKNALETGCIATRDNRSQFGFMDIRDAVSALIRMLDYPFEKWRRVYNLSSEKCWTISELAQIVKNAVEAFSGKTVEIKNESDCEQEPPLNTLVNADLFQKDFNWSATQGKSATIEAIVASMV
jgi:nucleoside-diphosphate-sugar epimerase